MTKQVWLAEALSRKERMDERKAAEIADEVRLSQETYMDDNEKGRNERAGNTPGKLENEVAEECQGKFEPEGSTGDSISDGDGDSNMKWARFDTSENQDVVTQLQSNSSGAVMLAIESAEMLQGKEEKIKTKQASSGSSDGPGEKDAGGEVPAAASPIPFTFGSINRRERPLRLLSDPVGNADVVDDDEFWQCSNCPIRTRTQKEFCIGCGSPRKGCGSHVPNEPRRLSQRNNDFSMKCFFGGSLSSAASAETENLGFLYPTTTSSNPA